jgi:nucleoside-diphosphate-sugar epimerase
VRAELVARCLIIACGCRGLMLATALRERGHAVRGTTRAPSRIAALAAAGVEPVLADPDRVSTLVPAFAQAGVACVLLGSATGPPATLEALHSSRLEMLLEKMVDTTLRGVVYERTGSVDGQLLAGGAERVERECARWGLPHALLDADPAVPDAWTAAAADAVERVLLGRGG